MVKDMYKYEVKEMMQVNHNRMEYVTTYTTYNYMDAKRVCAGLKEQGRDAYVNIKEVK